MFESILNLCAISIAIVTYWFDTIFSSTGMIALYLVMLFMWLCTRFLLKPIFGSYTRATYFFSRRKVGDD